MFPAFEYNFKFALVAQTFLPLHIVTHDYICGNRKSLLLILQDFFYGTGVIFSP